MSATITDLKILTQITAGLTEITNIVTNLKEN